MLQLIQAGSSKVSRDRNEDQQHNSCKPRWSSRVRAANLTDLDFLARIRPFGINPGIKLWFRFRVFHLGRHFRRTFRTGLTGTNVDDG
ncbi:hypothetical protein RRG08_042943 [Elysia crispata]|uniref:Uncharacterized protein n=1 Tax=Elysia crispata TaxID=231223 RepID=A0AAE1E4J1_9GAST|nr:hypothetical protein RRG08_042943 [Elysia crispata]